MCYLFFNIWDFIFVESVIDDSCVEINSLFKFNWNCISWVDKMSNWFINVIV